MIIVNGIRVNIIGVFIENVVGYLKVFNFKLVNIISLMDFVNLVLCWLFIIRDSFKNV